MNTKVLRNKILQLAMKGKLVSQDPNDEPASTLLQNIKEEKKKLIKDGSLKKGKPLSPITEEEIPYILPNGWEWVRLGDIGDWGAGSTPYRSNPRYYDGDILWLKTGELNDGYIDDTEEKITRLALKETSLRLNRPGDVLIAMYGATIGKLGILNSEATTNQACCACTPFSQISNIYLFYLLLSMREEFRKKGAGGAQPNISKQKIMQTVVPLPPFNEQKHIVEKVNESFALIEEFATNRDELLETINILRKEILQEAVKGKLVPQNLNDETVSLLLNRIKEQKEKLIKEGKLKKELPLLPITEDEVPYQLPSTWKWVRLGDITNYGHNISINPQELESNMWVLELEDIEKNSSRILKKVKFKERKSQSTKLVFNKDDVLYCKLRPYLNKVVVADENGVCSSEIKPIRGYMGINCKYLMYALKRPDFLAYVNKITYGTKMPRLGTQDGRKALFPFPPLNEQLRIVQKVDQLMSFCDELENNMK